MTKFFRPLLKKELAGFFGINIKTLNNWIIEYPALSQELSRYGNYKYQKIFTLKQVLIIYKYLGYPQEIDTASIELVPVKVFYKKQLAELYGISLQTLRKMIDSITEISHLNNNSSKKYDYKSIALIFHYLGRPYQIVSGTKNKALYK